MRTAAIYYFSGTGNTLKIAKEYSMLFDKQGIHCDLFDIGDGSMPKRLPTEFDIWGFAYPIHAFNAPYVVHKFIKSLPETENSKYFILKTSGEPLSINNVSSGKLINILKRKGYHLSNEYHYVMPYNMIFRHTDEMAAKMYNTAKQLCALDILDIIQEKPHFLESVPFGGVVATVLRIEHPAMKINGKFFRVSSNCIGCNACIKNCPVQNITRDGDKFKFGSKCIMCTKCSFNCPVDAFNIGLLNSWRVNGKYQFENPPANVYCKKPDFCKEAYNEYFTLAQKRIDSAKQANNNTVKDVAEVPGQQDELAPQGAI